MMTSKTMLVLLILILTTVIARVNALEENAKLRCYPENRRLFGKFLLQRWSDARKEIGFFVDPFAVRSLENAQMLKYIKLVDHVMNTVNSFTAGAKVYYNIEVPVPYIPIISCVENNIMKNLDLITTASKVDNPPPETKYFTKVIKTQTQLNLFLSAACIADDYSTPADLTSSESTEAKNSCADIKTFTFVMDPFQRFMKSVADFIWPHAHRRRDTRSVNLTIAMNMFAEIFEIPFQEFGGNHLTQNLGGIQSIWPMAGAFFQYNVDILGHIDNFESDWYSKVVPQYNLTRVYRYTDGNKKREPDSDYLSKRSSVNLTHGHLFHREVWTTHARDTMHQLFLRHPGYARAVCHLILVDFICLPMYPLPTVCAFLQKTRDNALEKLAQNEEILPHIIL